MTLKQLLQTNSWLSVSTVFLKLFPDQEKNMEGYERVIEKLLMMTPEETEMSIAVKSVIDDFDGQEYVDVSGFYNQPKNEEEAFSQAIEFTAWERWLGMEISTESLQDFSELEILAHCLHEMTFMGFDENEIKDQLNSLENTIEDYERMDEEEKRVNSISLEELLNESDELSEKEKEDEL